MTLAADYAATIAADNQLSIEMEILVHSAYLDGQRQGIKDCMEIVDKKICNGN